MSTEENRVRRLAEDLARGAIEGIELLAAHEINDDKRLGLTEDEVERAYGLATRTIPVIPPEVFTEACVGGCGKVYDLPEPHPGYICRRCTMMNRA